MEIKTEKNTGINSRIDEKEKLLIKGISGKISDCVENIMQSEIGEKLSDFSGTIENAEKKTADLGEAVENLSSTIKVIKDYDLVGKCYDLEKANEKINESSKEAFRIFEDSSRSNKKFTDDLTSLRTSLEKTKEEYDASVSSAKKVNDELKSNLDAVKKESAELTSLLNKADDILKRLDEKSNNELDLKLEASLNETKSELGSVSAKVDELMKPKKAPAAHAALIIIGILILILQAVPLVYEFFIQ